MQNAASDGSSSQADARGGNISPIVSDLVSLLEHLRAGIQRLEAAIVSERSRDDQETPANVFVLDDVTPRFARAHTALSRCEAVLEATLQGLAGKQEFKACN